MVRTFTVGLKKYWIALTWDNDGKKGGTRVPG
jgi:hypothetical protein